MYHTLIYMKLINLLLRISWNCSLQLGLMDLCLVARLGEYITGVLVQDQLAKKVITQIRSSYTH